MDNDAEIRADQANFEYPPRIVPYTGEPDTTDPDDPPPYFIRSDDRVNVTLRIREVRQGTPLPDPDDAEDAR